MSEKTHSRVTPEGRALGEISARLAERGGRRLVAAGLAGVAAPRLRTEMCKTCACRTGVVPNGCIQTQMDFLKSAVEGSPFLCHAPMDGRICAGWLRARAEVVAKPLPATLVDALEQWEYSPPDEAAAIGQAREQEKP